MKTLKILIPVAAALLFAAQAAAQQQDAEVRQAEAEAREQMRDAERQLEDAARRIAELSAQSLPRVMEMERDVFAFMEKPRLGVTVGGDGEGPVEGVSILGVTPGSAAADAGLRAGDVITSINGESLSAEKGSEAYRRLLDFMQGVEEGDKLDVEYLRDGNVGKVEVEPRVVEGGAYAWFNSDSDFKFSAPEAHGAPHVVRKYQFATPGFGTSWGDMELVELSEGLGRYFGVDAGLLVISAPEADAFQLQDGDVIQSIDGREPNSVGHAMRILASYQPGEKLQLQIIRDKREQTLDIEMPDDRTSFVLPQMLPRPAVDFHKRVVRLPRART